MKKKTTETNKLPLQTEVMQRIVSFSVVCETTEEYKRVQTILREFQRVVSVLAAENFALTLATSRYKVAKKTKGAYLVPDVNGRKALAQCVYQQATTGKTRNYEMRERFFELWNEAKALNPFIKDIQIGTWIYDAMSSNFTSMEQRDLVKRMNKNRFPLARNFPLAVLHCASRKGFVTLQYEDKNHIAITLRISNDPKQNIRLVLAGQFIKNGKVEEKKLNNGHQYVFSSFKSGKTEWSTPSLRNNDGKLFLDFYYKKPAIDYRKDAAEGRELQVVLSPEIYLPRQRIDKPLKSPWKCACKLSIMQDGIVPANADRFDCKLIRCDDTVMYLQSFSQQAARLELSANAAKSNWNKKVVKILRQKIKNLSQRRERYAKDCNSCWSREIVGQAKRFHAQKIIVSYPLEPNEEGEEKKKKKVLLFGNPWQWYQLKTMIRYKAEEAGFHYSESGYNTENEEVVQAFEQEIER
jgi:hypothetical protein